MNTNCETSRFYIQIFSFMSVIPVKDTLKYMNEARTNPSGFAKYVKKEIDQFINQSTLPLYPGCNYATNQGKSAWNEAYQFLLKQKPLPPFELNDGLSLAAEDHAIDMAKTNIFGHNSSDGTSFSARITKRCGQAYGSSGENIGTDFKVQGRDHALQTVLGLIIDDGVSNRGHRKNIFSTDFKYVGIASRVQGDKIITVMDFHSSKLPTINGSGNNSNAGGSLAYKQVSKPGGGWGSDFGGFGGKGGFGKQFGSGGNGLGGFGGGQISKGSHGGQRYIASKSTSTKTSTCNGIKKTIKTTKIKWSDGTEEEEIEETTTH